MTTLAGVAARGEKHGEGKASQEEAEEARDPPARLPWDSHYAFWDPALPVCLSQSYQVPEHKRLCVSVFVSHTLSAIVFCSDFLIKAPQQMKWFKEIISVQCSSMCCLHGPRNFYYLENQRGANLQSTGSDDQAQLRLNIRDQHLHKCPFLSKNAMFYYMSQYSRHIFNEALSAEQVSSPF